MGERIATGKKCYIYKNTFHTDFYHGLGYCELDSKLNTYEVFSFIHDGGYFPDDTPHYSKIGWDNLEDAKAFFLLQEI